MTYSSYKIVIPNGKNSGEITTTCPECSHKRKPENQKIKCLGVNLDKRCWRCNHCGWDGGLPPIENSTYMEQKSYTKPTWKNKTDLSTKMVQWFENRGISQNTLIKLKVTEDKTYIPQVKAERNCIQFNYFRDDELVNTKSRDGQKNFKLHSGAELIFYNLNSLKNAKECYIVEGEMETLTLEECGIIREGVGGVSVPNGANTKSNNLQYIDNCIELFDKIEKIYIATDDDIAGRKLREDLAERLGKERCYYLTYKGKKDLNEVLAPKDEKGKLIEKNIQAVIECCAEKKEFPLIGVFPTSVFADELKDLYHNGLDMGIGIGIPEFDKLLKFSKGYLTVVTGVSSHGKSSMLDQICVLLALRHGWKFAFYSPENRPTKLHLSNIIKKIVGKNWFGNEKLSEIEMNHGEIGYTEWEYNRSNGRFDVIHAGDTCHKDIDNWITKEQRQAIIELPEDKIPIGNPIIVADGESPF